MNDADGRLHARPGRGVATRVTTAGTKQLAGGALLSVPEAAAAGELCPLVVLFHGAGSSARAGLGILSGHLLLLAPQSAGSTWDVIRGGFGGDVARLDQILATVFASCRVDQDRIALGGFSDGASYALSLGIGNGDLITHVLAFSPGFLAPAEPRGRPRIFIAHGRSDAVLPIELTSRRIVTRLRDGGYDVTYEEFSGGHVVTADHARRAVEWLTGSRGLTNG